MYRLLSFDTVIKIIKSAPPPPQKKRGGEIIVHMIKQRTGTCTCIHSSHICILNYYTGFLNPVRSTTYYQLFEGRFRIPAISVRL